MNLHTFQMPKHNMTLLFWTKPDHSIIGLNYIPEMLDVEQYPIEEGFTINQALTEFVSMTEGDGDYDWSIHQPELNDFLDTVCHRIKQFFMVEEATDCKDLIRVIVPCIGWDRSVVFFLKNDGTGKIVGLNYWHGIDDFGSDIAESIAIYLTKPEPILWQFAAKPLLANGHPVYFYSSEFNDYAIDCINYSIDKYIDLCSENNKK